MTGTKIEKKLIEKLSELEHEQWRHWALKLSSELHKIRQYPLDAVRIADNIIKRWEPNFIDYSNLPEKVKDFDRIWAKKKFVIFKQYLYLDQKRFLKKK